MSSKRRLRRNACGKKVRYATQEEAMTAVARLHRAQGYHGMLTAYRCQFCGGFHFGHPPQHVRQAIGKRRA